MAFRHGTYAVTGQSIGEKAVSSSTCLVFVGTSKSGAAGDMALVHGKAEYTTKFGWDGDYATNTLEGAVHCAFDIGNLSEAVFITCGQSTGTADASLIQAVGKVKDIYRRLHVRPNIVCIPAKGASVAVANAVATACTDVLGEHSYDAQGFLFIGDHAEDTSNYIDALEDMPKSPRLSYFAWMCSGSEDESNVVDSATLYAVEQAIVDAGHDGIPFEIASNRRLRIAPVSQNAMFGRTEGNILNAKGLNTVIYNDGLRFWGGYLSTYDSEGSTDGAEVFLNVQRMINHRKDAFLRNHLEEIDRPMTRQLIDSILVRERAELDRLVAIGALVGNPSIEFRSEDNPTSGILQGQFVWSMQVSPTIPFASGTLNVAFTDSGYAVLKEEA